MDGRWEAEGNGVAVRWYRLTDCWTHGPAAAAAAARLKL